MKKQVDASSYTTSRDTTFDTVTPRIVSVVSAKAEANGKPVSLGTSLQIPLEILKATLASAENPGVGTEPMTAGIRRETGAKFVKP